MYSSKTMQGGGEQAAAWVRGGAVTAKGKKATQQTPTVDAYGGAIPRMQACIGPTFDSGLPARHSQW